MLSGRPHVEAAALMGAHGLRLVPLRPKGTRRMTAHARFAFIPRDDGGELRPVACQDLHALARHIERKRDDHGLELVDADDVEVPGRDALQTGVQVWLLGPHETRLKILGWAWLDGQGRERLEPALRTARNDLARHRRAA